MSMGEICIPIIGEGTYWTQPDSRLIRARVRPKSVAEIEGSFSIIKGYLRPADYALRKKWLKLLTQVQLERQGKLFLSRQTHNTEIVAVVPDNGTEFLQIRIGFIGLCANETLVEFARIYGLTPREREVMEKISYGLAPREVATQFCTGISTIRSQIKSILDKTGASSIKDLLMTLGQLPSTERQYAELADTTVEKARSLFIRTSVSAKVLDRGSSVHF